MLLSTPGYASGLVYQFHRFFDADEILAVLHAPSETASCTNHTLI